MNTMNIKNMVKDGRKVKFTHYHKNSLWYVTECGFEFPVPISDTGDAIFAQEDKALLFMRWIRKHLSEVETARQEQV